jgi:hypothetical protein
MNVSRRTGDEMPSIQDEYSTEIVRRAERAIRGETVGRDTEQVLNAIMSRLHNMRARGRCP